MNRQLRQRLAVLEIVTTTDLAECGYDASAVRRLVRAGALHRVHRGAYVAGRAWQEARAERRHLLRARAVVPRWAGTAASHVSAVIAHGLPVHDAGLALVHLTRTRPGRTGRSGDVYVHPELDTSAFVTDGIPICEVAVAVLQTADWDGYEAGMVAAEAALHTRRIAREDLRRARAVVRLGRGRSRADMVVALADRHSESPGETLTRLLLRELDVPTPVQQARIELASGRIARVDFLLPSLHVVVEYDGAVKYEGVEGRDALVREKRREDGIRRRGFGIVRLTRPDLDRPAAVQRWIDAEAAHARRRLTPTAVS
jgi:predicted transcriptional regulator of viral defense system